jgi:hypothetical protein
MPRKITIAFFILIVPLYLNAKGMSKAKIFGIAGFTCSLFAIGSDILAEHYNEKYEETATRNNRSHYHDIAATYERVRDVSFIYAVASFTLGTVFWLEEKKSAVSFEFNHKQQKLRFGLKKDF